jgi:hypothetical protein
MDLVKDIIAAVKDLAQGHQIREEGGYSVVSAFFESTDYDKVWGLISPLLRKQAERGELIEGTISRGGITDSGVSGFEIVKGMFVELYDYPTTTAFFLRLYHLKSDKKEWVALYIDKNPKTPWWSEEERGLIA